MPYRRLPNTDAARLKALRTAIEKSLNTDYQELLVSHKVLKDAKRALAHFEHLHSRYGQVYETQVKANKSFLNKVKNARMYVSHFVQVLYMSVMRSEINSNQLKTYGLQDCDMLVPDLTTYEQLLDWGEKIIEGENKRVSTGGVPIYNPSIAKVKVMHSLFKDGYNTQKLHQKATARLLNEVAEYRKEVDNVIFEIWEEVEKKNENLPIRQKLERNREYGIVYYYRKGEMVE